jgi:hypothetical protein
VLVFLNFIIHFRRRIFQKDGHWSAGLESVSIDAIKTPCTLQKHKKRSVTKILRSILVRFSTVRFPSRYE